MDNLLIRCDLKGQQNHIIGKIIKVVNAYRFLPKIYMTDFLLSLSVGLGLCGQFFTPWQCDY